ncbi:Hypothetical predicted protein [Octopus vulgaris]|uniref:Methyltransferase domain-containing protein n=1 Tax=Octopus vulgaris TaxID=6645 RepID=A0AA36BRI0_OCTVU|nr:Hypothetical predicted protein [Octopus vulgaris]
MLEEKAAEDYIKEVGVDDKNAYSRNFTAHQKGISREEMTKSYSDWIMNGNYEEDLGPNRYRGPIYASQALANLYEDNVRPSTRVLDVAAGSGFLGEKLASLNFKNIDALDPSAAMLEKAKVKGVYTNFYCKYFDKDIDIPNDSYDALVICGGMGEGHIPADAVPKMIDLVKKGGHVVIVMRKEYLTYVLDYKDKLLPLFHRLEEEKKWKMISDKEVSNYSFNKTGIVFIFSVL